MALVLLVAMALDGLVVRTTTPLALCPTVEAVELAVSERVKVVGAEDKRWELVLENVHRAEPPAADLLHVQLFDDTGAVRAEQELDVSGADCAVRAQAVAVVVADHFEAMPVSGSVAAVESPPAELAPPRPHDAPSEPARERDAPPVLTLGAGAGLSTSWSPGAAVRASVHAARRFDVSLLALAPVRSEQALSPAGEAEGLAFPLRAAAALSLPGRRADVWIGPEFLAAYERGTTRSIAQERTNHRMVWGLGAQAGLRLHGSGPWGAYLVVALDFALPVAGSRFEVDGETVLEPGPLLGAAALGVDHDLF
jgi:hypothetical protein